jgi:hypothetical protein
MTALDFKTKTKNLFFTYQENQGDGQQEECFNLVFWHE